MSVPYETAAYEPPESPESPEEHLARLLGRALNSFELPDEVIQRLECALAHDSSLHSAHHSSGLHRETYRHTWLLADGSALTLWELVHNPAPGSAAQHEVYVDEEELRAATARLPLPPDTPDFELPVTVHLSPVPAPRHAYAPDDSADHARRLLRRAENTDRPGAETAALLTTAFAHQITQALRASLPRTARGTVLRALRARLPAARRRGGLPLGGRAHGHARRAAHVRGVRDGGRGAGRDGAAGGSGLLSSAHGRRPALVTRTRPRAGHQRALRRAMGQHAPGARLATHARGARLSGRR